MQYPLLPLMPKGVEHLRDPKTDIQVLSPMNRSLLGARNLNQVLQAALNPGEGGPEVQRFCWTFRIGDRVIQTENLRGLA